MLALRENRESEKFVSFGSGPAVVMSRVCKMNPCESQKRLGGSVHLGAPTPYNLPVRQLSARSRLSSDRKQLMALETVSNISITDEGVIVIALESGGKPSYQYVYRSAAGVYWDQDGKAFTFATKNDGNYARWFAHILKVIDDEMGVQLRLAKVVTWGALRIRSGINYLCISIDPSGKSRPQADIDSDRTDEQ